MHYTGVALTPEMGCSAALPKTWLHPPDMTLWWVEGCIDIAWLISGVPLDLYYTHYNGIKQVNE